MVGVGSVVVTLFLAGQLGETSAVAGAAHDARRALQGHDVRLQVSPSMPLVRVDAQLLHHCLLNLLDNAGRYGDPGTDIIVEGVHLYGQIRLTILDHGPGLPPGREAEVFETFRRLEDLVEVAKHVTRRSGTAWDDVGLRREVGHLAAEMDALWAMIKRNISLKAFETDEPAVSGKVYKVRGKILQGIAADKAKEISKVIRDEKLKGVQAQIQGDQLRVSGKKKDDLQAVIALLKGRDFGIALQFVNYR